MVCKCQGLLAAASPCGASINHATKACTSATRCAHLVSGLVGQISHVQHLSKRMRAAGCPPSSAYMGPAVAAHYSTIHKTCRNRRGPLCSTHPRRLLPMAKTSISGHGVAAAGWISRVQSTLVVYDILRAVAMWAMCYAACMKLRQRHQHDMCAVCLHQSRRNTIVIKLLGCFPCSRRPECRLITLPSSNPAQV